MLWQKGFLAKKGFLAFLINQFIQFSSFSRSVVSDSL